MEAIEIDDARFMGRDQPARIEFSPRLNALVGGRGTGKSTVVHALRIAARREVDLANLKAESEPRLEFDRFKRVPEQREVCLVMESGREASERRYRRLGPEPTHVR